MVPAPRLDADPFAHSVHLSISQLELRNTLPPSTHLTGTISLVWGNLTSKTWSGNAVTCLLKTYISIKSAPRSDLALSVPTEKATLYSFRLLLRPSGLVEANEESLSRMEEERERLLTLVGKLVTIDCSGVKVEKVEKQGPGMLVHLEGVGERQLMSKSTGKIKILADLANTSGAPSWFAASSVPPVSAPVPQRDAVAEAPPVPTAGVSRLRPLSAHAVPTFAKPAPHEKMRTNQNKWPASPQSSSEKQTRVEDRIGESVLATARIPQASGREEPQNPVKRPPSPKISPETRRPRVEERDESSASVSEPASNGVWENRTVIQLGPSFRGTDPTPVFAPRSAGTSAVQESPPGPAPSDLPVFDDAATDIEQGPEKETTAGVDTELVEDEVATENGQQQIIDRKADQTETRRMAEEAILAQRRKIAEAEARVKAAAELSVRNLEKQKEVDDITRMKRPFSVSGMHYTPIAEMAPGIRNVVGIVIETLPPRETKTRDWSMSVVIADPSSHTDGFGSNDFIVTVFRKTIAELPTDVSPGTPILIRGIKVTVWNDKPKGQAFTPGGGMSSTNTWATLPSGKTLKLANPHHMSPAVGKVELDRLSGLLRWWKASNGRADVASIGAETDNRRTSGGSEEQGGRHGNLTFNEVREGMFFDAAFKIMHVIANTPPRPALELYISDGTISPQPTRNFHNVDLSIPPSAVFSLAIKDLPPMSERHIFEVGNFVKTRNVRAKVYQGGLELIWSELVTSDQLQQGWNRRRGQLVGKEDERAKVIERRIRALKLGEDPRQPPQQRSVALEEAPVNSDPMSAPHLATHVSTTLNDPIEHPTTSLSALLTNATIPNKFRIQARVKSVHPRGLAGNQSLVQKHCTKCDRFFAGEYCQSCNDTELNRAELRYRFLAILEQEDQILPVIIADDDAASFLPPLPPLSASNNPNDYRKTLQRIREASAQVYDVLLGAKQDGERPRPMIDFSVQTYEVKGKGQARGVVVARVFGMSCCV